MSNLELTYVVSHAHICSRDDYNMQWLNRSWEISLRNQTNQSSDMFMHTRFGLTKLRHRNTTVDAPLMNATLVTLEVSSETLTPKEAVNCFIHFPVQSHIVLHWLPVEPAGCLQFFFSSPFFLLTRLHATVTKQTAAAVNATSAVWNRNRSSGRPLRTWTCRANKTFIIIIKAISVASSVFYGCIIMQVKVTCNTCSADDSVRWSWHWSFMLCWTETASGSQSAYCFEFCWFLLKIVCHCKSCLTTDSLSLICNESMMAWHCLWPLSTAHAWWTPHAAFCMPVTRKRPHTEPTRTLYRQNMC